MDIVQRIMVATVLHELSRTANEATRAGVVVFLAFAHAREFGRLDMSDKVQIELVAPRTRKSSA